MASVTLNPTKDRQGDGSGTATTMRIGTLGTSVGRAGLVYFDLSALRIKSITTATLKLYPGGSSGYGGGGEVTFVAYRATQDWVEGGTTDVTSNDDSNATQALALASGGAGDTISLNVKPTLDLWVAGTANYGFRTLMLDNPGSGYVDYYSREGSTQPELVLVYVEPGGYQMML